MQNFKGRYWLINGEAFPDTDPITTAPGNTVLLRYLNASVRSNAIGLLGLYQTVLAVDSSQLMHPYQVVVESLGAGQAMDTLVSIPSSAPEGGLYLLHNSFHKLHNNGLLDAGNRTELGGAITFLEVIGGLAVPNVGPLVSNVSVAPALTTGNEDVILTAYLDETATGNANIVEWEYFINQVGPAGTGISATVAAPASGINVSATIISSTVAALPAGDVTFYVRGRDADGAWGPVSSAVLDLVVEGPMIRGMVLTPGQANGDGDVALRATADDTPTGEVNVVAAEFFSDTVGANGTGIPMDLNMVGPLVEISAVIPALTVQGLDEGYHTLYIHAQDELGNWGAYNTISLLVDKTGPTAVGLTVLPSPNNGTLSINSSTSAVRVRALIADDMNYSAIERAEGFIDYVDAATNPNGTGFPLIARDSRYNGTFEEVYIDIPLTTVRLLAEGPHSIDMHGKDVAGNWGPIGSLTLVVDRTGPDTGSPIVLPNPTRGSTNVTLITTVTDPDVGAAAGSPIQAAEWFEGFDPGPGLGNPLPAADGNYDSASEVVSGPIDVNGWANGNHTLSVRSKDAAGNWGDANFVSFRVTANNPRNIFLSGFETGDLAGWDEVVGAVTVLPGAALEESFGLEAVLSDTPAYIADRTPLAEATYQAGFLFDPSGADTNGEAHDIFVGLNAAGTPILGIEFETSPAGPEARAWVRQGGVNTFTDWYHLAAGASHLQITWESDPVATLIFEIDGQVQATLTGLDTEAYRLDEVRLGPSSGLSTGMSGVERYDSFTSYRMVLYQVFLPVVGR